MSVSTFLSSLHRANTIHWFALPFHFSNYFHVFFYLFDNSILHCVFMCSAIKSPIFPFRVETYENGMFCWIWSDRLWMWPCVSCCKFKYSRSNDTKPIQVLCILQRGHLSSVCENLRVSFAALKSENLCHLYIQSIWIRCVGVYMRWYVRHVDFDWILSNFPRFYLSFISRNGYYRKYSDI